MTTATQTAMRWTAAASFAASVVLLVATIPVAALLDALQARVEGLGLWAPVAYAVSYGIATTLFVPGSALSLAAGAVFGVGQGTVVVWLGATLALTLSFLIARYFARARVEAFAGTRPRFAAVDRAVGEQGWRIVAWLRLSPVFPFSLQNYLFGVTAVRFWPYCIASALFILPGTFLYVALGYVGSEAAANVGGGRGIDALKLVLQVVGLVATVAASVVVARIAAKAVAKHAPPDDAAAAAPEPAAAGGSRKPAVAAIIGLACLAASAAVFAQREAIREWFVPPRAALVERHASAPGTATFDHAAFDALLRDHVDADGRVDYASLIADGADLREYVRAVGAAPFDALSRDEKLALLLNAYNAFTLQLVCEHYPLDSIRSIPAAERWDAERWEVAGGRYSLDQIEHLLIRDSFREDRIHFALACAAVGCPKLRREAYAGSALEGQLASQAADIHRDERWFRFDEAEGTVWLTQVYNWYADDFARLHGSVLEAAAKHSTRLRRALAAGRSVRIRWLPYDWALNGRAAA